MKRFIPLIAAIIFFSCQGQGGLAVATISIGNAKIKAELAVTPQTRETGLMGRESVPEGTGMLFAFPQDQKLSFWMKNTSVPLSIAYIAADGTILEIFDMQPLSLAPVNGQHYARYALEVPQGWFGKTGIKPGDTAAIPSLPPVK